MKNLIIFILLLMIGVSINYHLKKMDEFNRVLELQELMFFHSSEE